MTVDEKLNWKNGLGAPRRYEESLAAVEKIEKFIPQPELCKVYYALIDSHLRIANFIWSSVSKAELAAL